MKSDGRLLLVDCHALLYRGHFAMMRNPLRAADGTNTSGLYFLISQILDRREADGSDLVAAVFDHPGPTFRNGIYPEYKANRPPMPDDLRRQSRLARKLIPSLGVPLLEKDGFEADDIIALLAQEASEAGYSVEILSSDKDLLQLASGNVTVIRPGPGGRDVVVTESEVQGILGVRADQVADFLALTGDSSDNVPGVRGVGRKTAVNLLRKHGSLEGVYSSLDSLPGPVRSKLEAGRESADLSRRLVSLVPARDSGFRLHGISMSNIHEDTASRLLSELNMTSIMERLGLTGSNDLFGAINGGEDTGSWCSVRVIEDPCELKSLLPPAEDSLLAIDTETTSRDPFRAEPVGVSIADSGERAWYIPLSGPQAVDVSKTVRILGDLLANRRIVVQNGKYDMHVLERLGLRIPELAGDPMIADYILRPEIQSHSLSNLSVTWLGRRMMEYDQVVGQGDTLLDADTEKVASYCGCDSATALELSGLLRRELENDPRLLSIYTDVELPLVRLLADMESRGVGIDMSSLSELEEDFTAAIEELQEEATRTAGCPINLNSPSQVSGVLFDTLGLPSVRKTATGADSSSMEVLERLQGQHPFVDTLIEHRELSKLLNTYVRRLPDYICPSDGLIHTSFSQTVASTGRLSSSSPNLQNIPIRTSRGRQVRKCFVPGIEGHVFVTADYSQIELRILAHFAGPGNMRQAYEKGLDIHAMTAEAVFGDSSPEHRRKAKEVNFSILYGISPWGLSNRLNIPRGDAADIIDRYIGTYPEVDSFFRECVEFAERNGETRTLLGRKREFRGMASAKGAARSSMERMAVNTTIQGSAADIIKLAMLRVQKRLATVGQAGLVLQVHDELVAVAPRDKAGVVAAILAEEMSSAYPLEVPLIVDTGIGENWLEAQH